MLALASCSKSDIIFEKVTNPISISSPTPVNYVDALTLDAEQQGYVKSANSFAFNCLAELYNETKSSIIFSPLSLQYALAMAVNGASGETAAEITRALGFGSDIESLNTYCNLLLNQLPALDKNVELKLTDAMLVTDRLVLKNDYQLTLKNVYYAPVQYISTESKKEVVNRINEWAYHNTNGFIDKLIDESDVDDAFVAAIMNALYFKAKWAGTEYSPMFMEEATMKNETFYLDGGGKAKLDLMRTSDYFAYSERSGYRVAAIPYASGKYCMYILLPDVSGKDGLATLVKQLPSEKWSDILASLKYDTNVHLRLPKFKIENKFDLNDAMKALGVKKAFDGEVAEFDRMFDASPDWSFWIGKIIQKAKISVAEWGTEAAAVTVVMMDGATSAGPGPDLKEVNFYADHPFVYVIADSGSGTILFEGVFDGK